MRKQRKDEEDFYEEICQKNTLTADGLDHLIHLLTGTLEDHMAQNFTSLEIGGKDFIGSDVAVANGTPVKAAPSFARKWEFHDDTPDTYTITTAAVHAGDVSNPTTGGQDGGPVVQISSIDASAFETKPTSENWHYIYELEFYSTDSDFQSAGFARMLGLVVGDLDDEMIPANMKLNPKDAVSGSLGTPTVADSSSGIDTVNDKFGFVFVVGDGELNGDWDETEIIHNHSTLGDEVIRDGGCKQDGSACGTKGAGEEWEYTYEFLMSQGS